MFHRDRDLHPENPKDRTGPLRFYVKPLAPNFSEVPCHLSYFYVFTIPQSLYSND